MGASKPPLMAKFNGEWFGTYAATTAVSYSFRNTTPGTLGVRVDIRSEGLDGRDVSRNLWQGTLAANTTSNKTFKLDRLPIQTVASKGINRLVVEVTSASGQPHLVGVKYVSTPLATVFSSDYASVTISGDDLSAAPMLDNPTTEQQLAAQLAPHLPALLVSQGRVWNGASFDNVTTLPANGMPDAHIGRTIMLAPSDALAMSNFGPLNTEQPVADGGFKACVTLRQNYIDEGRGEPVLVDQLPASYWWARFARMNGEGIWQDYLDSAGCTPAFALTVGEAYKFSLHTAARDPLGREVRVFGDGTVQGAMTVFSVARSPSTGLPALAHFYPSVFRDENAPRSLAALTAVLLAEGVRAPAKAYTARMGYCLGLNKGAPGAYTACGVGANELWLGYNDDAFKSHNSQWKFVVAHEFGHLIQSSYSAAVSPAYEAENTPDGGSSLPSACTCDHVGDPVERSHCMTSREFLAGVQNEGYAHGVAAATFLGNNPSSCPFVYYKESRVGWEVKRPPIALDCATPIRWMENQCPGSDRGVEWDWLNWQRAMDVNSARIDNEAFAAVMRNACGGACSGTTPSMAQLKASAAAEFGPDSPKELSFRQSAFMNGVDY